VLRGVPRARLRVRRSVGRLQCDLDEAAGVLRREDDGAEGAVDEGLEVALADA